MAGRNKRAAVVFLRDLSWAMIREASELRDAEERIESHRQWRNRGVEGLEQDVAEGTMAYVIDTNPREIEKLYHLPLAVCRINQRPENWAWQFPHMFTGHVDWRGNRFPFEVSSESVLERRRRIVREIARGAGRSLATMPCRHVGEKTRRGRTPWPMPITFIASAAAVDTACLEMYVRCEDCGEEVARG